jgi:hypothetical protein
LLVAAVCSLFGLIHSPLADAPLNWRPDLVWRDLASDPNPNLRFQSPYHWAAAYVLAAAVVWVGSLIPARAESSEASQPAPIPSDRVTTAPEASTVAGGPHGNDGFTP